MARMGGYGNFSWPDQEAKRRWNKAKKKISSTISDVLQSEADRTAERVAETMRRRRNSEMPSETTSVAPRVLAQGLMSEISRKPNLSKLAKMSYRGKVKALRKLLADGHITRSQFLDITRSQFADELDNLRSSLEPQEAISQRSKKTTAKPKSKDSELLKRKIDI